MPSSAATAVLPLSLHLPPVSATRYRSHCVRPDASHQRHTTIDVTRGVFLLLMLSSHAIGLTEVTATSFFRSIWWLPRGWATPSFLFLTGITAAFSIAENPQWTRRFRRRGVQLLAVVVGSNLIFLLCKYLLAGQMGRLNSLRAWFELLIFQSDSTISVILLPTALVLIALPAIVPFQRRRPILFGIAAILTFLGSWALQAAPEPLTDRTAFATMIVFGFNGFPIIPLACNAGVGLVIGRVWHQHRHRMEYMPWFAPLAVVMFIIVLGSLTTGAIVEHTLGAVLRVGTIIGVSVAITQYAAGQITRCLSLLGRFGLFVFIAHRAVMHALVWVALRVPATASARYAAVASTTLGLVGSLCVLRLRYAQFDRLCRMVYM